MARRERMTLAPVAVILSSFSYMIFHSASTMLWYCSTQENASQVRVTSEEQAAETGLGLFPLSF